MKNGKRFLCFCLIFLMLFLLSSSVLQLNTVKDAMHIRGFFKEPENTIDVIHIGASEVYTSINSPLMWEEYGFTSYSVSFAGAPGDLYRSMLEEALNRQNPQLVVIEINGFLNGDQYFDNTAKKHTWFDNIPYSETKWASMKEMIPEEQMGEFVFNFLKYHDNWRHPLKCLKNFYYKTMLNIKGISDTKCFGTTTECRGENPFDDYKPKFTDESKEYLIELLEYCKEMGLEQVLFLRTPHCINNKNPKAYDQIEAVISRYGYDFLNLESAMEEVGLDPAKDFYNKDHMNTYGMEKMTAYLGKYISSHYEIHAEHSEETRIYWDQCAEKMHKILEKSKEDLKEQKKKDYYEISYL